MRFVFLNSIRSLAALVVVAAAAVTAAQAPQDGTIRGTVSDVGGAALPRTAVTLNGPDNVWTDLTGSDGGYSFERIPPGTYAVKAEASHFCSQTISNVAVSAAGTRTVDFALWLGDSGWLERDDPENLQIVHRLTDVVAHVRIERWSDARLWDLGNQQRVGVSYRAAVMNSAAKEISFDDDTIDFAQYPAGSLSVGGRRYCGTESMLPEGAEYVAFLRRIDGSTFYRFLGPQFLIPVVRGQLAAGWLDDTEISAVHDGIAVADFLEIVRGFPAEVGLVADSNEVRIAVFEHVLRSETDRLARAGLPQSSERLTYCLAASPTAGAAGAVPTDFVLFNESFGRRSDPNPEYFDRLASGEYDLVPASNCEERSGGVGVPMVSETHTGTRGLIRVGPAYHVGEDRAEVPASIHRHTMSAASWILYLEKQSGGWRVVDERFIWGA